MPRSKGLGIINYGAGNFGSVTNAIRSIGLDFRAISNPKELDLVSHIILPGVGAFAHTMERLRSLGFIDEIGLHVEEQKKPFLGICVGMQVLASVGNEHEPTAGMGIIPGTVDRIPDKNNQIRIPHMGWSEVDWKSGCPIFNGIDRCGSFYFVHSYVLNVDDAAHIAATCDYGDQLTVAVQKENIFGVQFHPEKSQSNGLRLLKNFYEQVNWE